MVCRKKTISLILKILIVACLFMPVIYFNFIKKESAPFFQEPQKENVRIIMGRENNNEKTEALLELIGDYTENNNNTEIIIEYFSNEELYAEIMTEFVTMNEADIIIEYPTQNIRNLFERGKIAKLNSILSEDPTYREKTDKVMLDALTESGDVFGIPTEKEFIAMYTNKKLLQKCGITAPKTAKELVLACEKLRRNGIIPIAFGAKDYDMYLYQILAVNEADEDNRLYSENAVEYMKRLYEISAFPDNYNEFDRREAQRLFLSGDAAIIFESSSFGGIVEKQHLFENSYLLEKRVDSANFDINIFPENSGEIIYTPGRLTYYLSKKAFDEKPAAVDVLKYLTSDVAAQYLYNYTNNIPANKEILQQEKNTELLKERDKLLEKIKITTPLISNSTDSYTWYTNIAPCIQKNIIGETAIAETKKQIEDRLKIIKYR